ncbi:FmdB family zinc ribbon protein [Cerasicoccus frondis]|uniref:FmdB family zinc ribbon protein n=1 Tax=Cerasicoccus frondis TaxID=490090 RepID=UPI0028526544|nr:zinc ribbon domain-containing protein [Cerasicoccus frondis]
MPVYIYETVHTAKERTTERFELYQSIHDAALTHHPESGAPVRRVITGGLFLPKKSGIHTGAVGSSDCCGTC